MRGRLKGRTLIARDGGDGTNGVVIKLYGEETNGAISITEQPFEPGLLLPPFSAGARVGLEAEWGRCRWVWNECVAKAKATHAHNRTHPEAQQA